MSQMANVTDGKCHKWQISQMANISQMAQLNVMRTVYKIHPIGTRCESQMKDSDVLSTPLVSTQASAAAVQCVNYKPEKQKQKFVK